MCSFSYDCAYFLPKSWFGSCCATKDIFILFEDLWSYPWPQLSEIQTHAHIFSLQAKNRRRNRLYSSGFQILLVKGLPDLQEKKINLGTVISDAATLVFIYGQITSLQDIFLLVLLVLLALLFTCLPGWECAQ